MDTDVRFDYFFVVLDSPRNFFWADTPCCMKCNTKMCVVNIIRSFLIYGEFTTQPSPAYYEVHFETIRKKNFASTQGELDANQA